MPCCCVWTESGDESPARTADKALSLRVSTSGVLLRTSSTESANRDVADKKAQEGRGFVRWRGLPCSRRIRRDERSEEHTSELQSRVDLVCRLLLEKKKKKK